jgi:hypothetical protein
VSQASARCRVPRGEVFQIYADFEQHRCAALNGVAKEIIKRAEQLILLESLGEDLIAACAILPESEVAELQEAVGQQLIEFLSSC